MSWVFSRYTDFVDDGPSYLLLHNSFMGAVARLPRSVFDRVNKHIESSGDTESSDLTDSSFAELVTGGFIVRSTVDERERVEQVLELEREHRFGMIVMPHENCNFRCVYCYEKFLRGIMPRPIVEGLKKLVSAKSSEYAHVSVSWFGGEPLIAKDIVVELSDSFIHACELSGARYSSSMTTNGFFLTPDVFEALIQRRVNGFQITLDGPEEVHNETRKFAGGRKGTYRRILDNLIAMKATSYAFSVKIRVNFNSTSSRKIERWIVDEIGTSFAGDSRFGLDFHPIGKWGGPNDDALDTCRPQDITSIRTRLQGAVKCSGMSQHFLREKLSAHGNVCYAARKSSIIVGSDGTIYKCSKNFDDPRNKVGRLKADGGLEIDRELWTLWTELGDSDTTRCGKCSFFGSCQSRSCPLDTINHKKPLCPMPRAEYESLVRQAVTCTHATKVSGYADAVGVAAGAVSSV